MGRIVVVSGGNRGLGRAIVESFLADPDIIVATFSRSETHFIEEMRVDKSNGKRFYFAAVDIGDRNAVGEYLREVAARFGPVSILINNAGIALSGVLALQRDEEIERLISTNLQGTINLTKGCIRQMLTQGWGRVINISSVVGLSGYRGLSAYSMTKAGLDGLTRSLARELGSRQITVNSVAPGFLETEMTHGLTERQRQQIMRRTPMGRLGRPEDICPLVRFLCSEDARFITGQTIVVDGGATA